MTTMNPQSKTMRQSTLDKKNELSLNSGKSLSIYFKILINYAQMVSIIHNLELKWPFYVTTYLKVTGNVGTISTELLSLDCLISDYNIDINAIYLKALITILIYTMFLTTASFIFTMRQVIFRKKRQINKLIILAIVLSIMIQPNSIKETSNIFNCQKIQEQSYLTRQMSILCYTFDHKKWVYKFFFSDELIPNFIIKMTLFGIPILLFWIVLYPITCLFYLIFHRKQLENIQIKIKMGFYLNGYKKNYFYW